MIRAVLAVVLAAALLGVSLPAIDDARRERTAAQMDRTVDRIADTALALLANDPGRDSSLAPGRSVRLHLPVKSWTAAPVESLRIEGRGRDRPAVVRYDLPGRPPISQRIDAPIETRGPIVVRSGGVHRLRFELLLRHERPAVVVERA